MAARVIAITAQKGGVSKTTSSVNLSAALALMGKRILLIDLDPQANATYHVGVDPQASVGKGTYEVFTRKINIKDAIVRGCRENFDMVPSHELLCTAEMEAAGWIGREKLMAKAIEQIRGDYDFILFDCPPGMGLLTANAFAASTEVLLTVQPELFSVLGLNLFNRLYEDIRANCNPTLELGGVLISMIDGKVRGQCAVHRDAANGVESAYGDKVFKTRIRLNTRLKEAPGHHMTIFEHAPGSPGAEDYMNLAKEVCGERNEKARPADAHDPSAAA